MASWLSLPRFSILAVQPRQRKTTLPALLELEGRVTPALAPVLVHDINTGNPDSHPRNLTAVGTTLFFAANDSSGGLELWKSDGTAVGTVRVKDINPGAASSNPQGLTAVGGILYFSASDGTTGRELWRSDGTEAGTVLVRDINPGPGNSNPGFSGNLMRQNELVNAGGTLIFSADDGTNGIELWKSDGTEQGTVLVKDIRPGGNSYARYLAHVGGTVFFSAFSNGTGFELWKSDGTESGTTLVRDIRPGTGFSDPRELMNANGTLYFTAEDGSTGRELWKSDGSTEGTILVHDINPGSGEANPLGLTAVDGTLFFIAHDGTNGTELWKTDGTGAGTSMVLDIEQGSDGSLPSYVTNFNGTVYFSAFETATGRELWKSDGTAAGTVLVRDIGPGVAAGNPTSMTVAGGSLFFAADDGVNGVEAWQTDGTSGGTVLLGNIREGSGSAYPRSLANVAGNLFFAATDGVNGFELWKLAPANQAPVISSAGTASQFEGFNFVMNVAATDADAGDIIAYSISGGADAALFTINTETGLLAFKAATDFEHPGDANADNAYEVTVRASDGSLADDLSVVVTVLNRFDGVSLSNLSVLENLPAGSVVGTLAVDESGLAAPPYRFELANPAFYPDNARFAIVGDTLVTAGPFDYEAGSTNFSVTVRALDANNTASEGEFVISLVNDPGELAVSTPSVAHIVCFKPTPIAGITVSDLHAGLAPVTVSLSVTTGNLTLPTRAGLQFVTGDGAGDRSLSFRATVADANAALAGLTYISEVATLANIRIHVSASRGPAVDADQINLLAATGRVERVADPGTRVRGLFSAVIQATNGPDTVSIRPVRNSSTDYQVVVNGTATTLRGITGRLIVFGLSGNDDLDMSAARVPARLIGGFGDDVLLGGAMRDVLYGESGADLLAGGLEIDQVEGGLDNDIVVDGLVSARRSGVTPRSTLDRWAAMPVPGQADYAALTADLAFTPARAERDRLAGGTGVDWFWAAAADVVDMAAGERRRGG